MSEWITNKRPFGVGQELFREGQPPRDAFLIERGRVEISKMQGDRKVILGYREAGDVVGEMALIDNAPRSATAIAEEPTVCVIITEKLFHEHLNRVTPLLRKVLLTFTRNLRTMGEQVVRTDEVPPQPLLEVHDET